MSTMKNDGVRQAVVWIQLAVLLTGSLAISACKDTSVDAPPVVRVSTLGDYFWTSAGLSGGMRYLVYDGNGVQTGEDVLSGRPDSVVDVSGSTSSSLSFIVTPDSVILTTLGASGLFPLPTGAYFTSSTGSTTSSRAIPISAVCALANGEVLAADSGQIYRSPDGLGAWTKVGGPIPNVNIFASTAATDTVVAGTARGIYYRVGGGTFNPIASTIGITQVNLLALTETGSIFFFHPSSRTVFQVGINPGSFPVLADSTSLAPTGDAYGMVYKDSDSRWTLDVACDSGVRKLSDAQSIFSRINFVGSVGGGTQSMVKSKRGVICLVDNLGTFYTANVLNTGWVKAGKLPFSNGEVVTASSVARTSSAQFDSVVFGTSKGNIYLCASDGSPLIHVDSLGVPISGIAVTMGGHILAATYNGLYDVRSANSKLVGPGISTSTPVTAGITLLWDANGRLDSGATWPAGYLKIPALPQPLPITATIIKRLDTLVVPGGIGSFGETYLIRYAYESNPGTPSGPFYWLFYYSRPYGPVLFEEYQLAGSVATLLKRVGYKR